MKTAELKKILKAHGCYFIKQGSNHEKWFSPGTNHQFQVPRHPTVKRDTAREILKEAGIDHRL